MPASLRHVKMFIEDTVHYQVDDAASVVVDEEWAQLYPGDGLVYLGNNNIDPKQPYTVSMFHQLRCLDIIRRDARALEARNLTEPTVPSLLAQHCVNYLRQMVLCRSDLDLDTTTGRPKPVVQPDIYRCYDWEAVFEAVERNQREFGPK